jgi:hypothetical protein
MFSKADDRPFILSCLFCAGRGVFAKAAPHFVALRSCARVALISATLAQLLGHVFFIAENYSMKKINYKRDRLEISGTDLTVKILAVMDLFFYYLLKLSALLLLTDFLNK